ncbi:MAG: PAS domain-containing sensor histidine kinase [Balneolales bacterium]|nr:PAS domain-containing sensor histidine kinase [Balneolales bacterium]
MSGDKNVFYQKSADANLQRLANLLSETQSLIGVGAWELDASSGNVLWTDEVYHLHGVDPEDFNPNLGDALSFYHPVDRPVIEDAVKKAVESGIPYTVTCRIVRPGGQLRHVKTSGKVESVNGKMVRIYGLIQDITDLKIAEKSLLESGGLTASLIEAMQEGVSILNGQYIQVSANPAFCKMTGFSEQELVGQIPPYPYWPEEYYDYIFDRFKQDPEPGKAFKLVFKKKNGERFKVMVSPSKVYSKQGDLLAYFATIRDLDEEIRTRQQLDDTLYQLKKTTNSVPGVIFQLLRVGPREIFVSYLSEGIQAIMPHLKPEMITANQSEGLELLLGPEQTERMLDLLEDSANYLEPFNQSITFDVAGGKKLVQVEAKPERLSNGQITWFGYAQDITELQRQNLILENLVKMTTQQNNRLLNFAQIVSHNIRSHTSNIMGLLEIIRESSSEQEVNRMLEMLGETGKKLDETLHNLNEVLTITRNANPIKEPVNVGEEIQIVLASFSGTLDTLNAQIILNVPDQLTIRVVPAYLSNILTNLISNSIKYRSPERKLELRIDVAKTSKGVQLRVVDNGLGLDAAKYRDQLFGMYRTFHGNEDARGLGLFLMKNQVEAMGGTIDLESEPDKGAAFIVNFV